MSTTKYIYDWLPSTTAGSFLRPARVLIADNESIVRESLARKLTNLGYVCDCCDNGHTALKLIASKNYDLLLADIMMPEMGGVNLLKKFMEISPYLAVILVTSAVDIEVAVDSLKDGAYDYITKPFSLEEVSISVSRALEKRRLLIENQSYRTNLEDQVAHRTRQLKEAMEVLEHTYHSTLVALSKALDSRNSDWDGHSLRVTMYTKRLAEQLGIDESGLQVIEQGALLHDIGKIGIPDELLRKPGNLTENEWRLMCKHPEIGYQILMRIKFLRGAAHLVLHHHERYDGTGYPGHLKGSEINFGARIFSIADILERLTSNRPFKTAISFEAASEKIARMAGTQLDPNIVEEFLKIPLLDWQAIRHQAIGNKPDHRSIC